MKLLHTSEICKNYPVQNRQKAILRNITFSIQKGETLAFLGQSGCGKSTLMRLLAGLEKPSSGDIFLEGRNFSHMDKKERKYLYQKIQLVFQDSVSAVNPRFNVAQIISEPLRYLSALSKQQRIDRAAELLDKMELPENFLFYLPSQLSGGQLQRVCIARALAVNPALLLLDEAVSNLDCHLQLTLMELLKKHQQEHHTSYLFITHDLRLVKKFASRCLVMDHGEIVEEISPVGSPLKHPLSQQLEQSVLPPFPPKDSSGF